MIFFDRIFPFVGLLLKSSIFKVFKDQKLGTILDWQGSFKLGGFLV